MKQQQQRWRPAAATAILALLLAAGLGASRGRADDDPARALEQYPSPADVAVSADGAWALTANQGTGTVSLVDLAAGRVAATAACGPRPTAVALSADGRRAVVSCTLAGTLAVLDVGGPSLRLAKTIPVGPEPRGVALSRDGQRAYVALTTADAVAAVDLEDGKVTRSPAGARPWFVALSPDEQTLVVDGSRSRDVTLLRCPKLETTRSIRLAGQAADNPRQVAFSPDGQWAYLPHQVTRGFPTQQQNIDNGWVIASRASRVPLAGEGPRESLALDTRGQAVGDPYGLAVSPDGRWLAIGASGTHELLLFRLPLPFVAYGGPGDLIEPELLKNDGRFRRIPLGGRPMGLRFSPDSHRVLVANYLSDALQVVDAETGAVRQAIDLGGPKEPTAGRRGEAIFYDAARSHNQWFSCGSCHVEGHTNRQLYDTFNDGQYGNGGKITPSLRHVTQTGPWTWHGWQTSLTASIANSIETTQHGTKATDAEVADVAAFLATLTDPPNPNRGPRGELTPAARAGEALFTGKAACAGCHPAPLFTDGQVHDVGLGAPTDRYQGFNPPSLLGLYDRSPYLHDGRAKDLEDLLTQHHTPETLSGGPPLAPAERKQLVAYLESL